MRLSRHQLSDLGWRVWVKSWYLPEPASMFGLEMHSIRFLIFIGTERKEFWNCRIISLKMRSWVRPHRVLFCPAGGTCQETVPAAIPRVGFLQSLIHSDTFLFVWGILERAPPYLVPAALKCILLQLQPLEWQDYNPVPLHLAQPSFTVSHTWHCSKRRVWEAREMAE